MVTEITVFDFELFIGEQRKATLCVATGAREEGSSDLITTVRASLSRTILTWAAQSMDNNIPVITLKILKLIKKRLMTSNWLENLNGKIKKRTSVVGLFPSVESVLRLVSAVLMETDERWLTGKRYLNMNTGVND